MRQGRTASDRLTDQELLQCLAEGKLEALSVLYERYASRLYPLALSWLGRADLAEDVVQDAFLQLMQRGAKVGRIRNFQAYLFRMVRNQSCRLSHQRAKENPQAPTDSLNLVEARSSDDREGAELLNRALSKLLPEQREVVMLKTYDNMTFKEIAAALGIPANTAASRYRYALGKLKNLLERKDGRLP